MPREDLSACALCERRVPAVTRHHLFPRSVARRKGRKIADLPTADLCPACHRQLHVLFDNKQLATQFDTVEALRAQPEIERFLQWIRKQPPEKWVRIRR